VTGSVQYQFQAPDDYRGFRVSGLGLMERLVLVIIGALFNRMAPVLWAIAVLSTLR
jgi:hypothetical protein